MKHAPAPLLLLSVLLSTAVACGSSVGPQDETGDDQPPESGGFRDCDDLPPDLRKNVEQCVNDDPEDDDDVVVITPDDDGSGGDGGKGGGGKNGGGKNGGGKDGDSNSGGGGDHEPFECAVVIGGAVIDLACDDSIADVDGDGVSDGFSNPGCQMAQLWDNPEITEWFGVPTLPAASPTESCAALSVEQPSSCRSCLARGLTALSGGSGTLGMCSPDTAAAHAAMNRFVLAGEEPDAFWSAYIEDLRVRGVRREISDDPEVQDLRPCPVDLSIAEYTREHWDDELYVDPYSCDTLCDEYELDGRLYGPKGAIEHDCDEWFYVDENQTGEFELTDSPPSTEKPADAPSGWKPPIVVETKSLAPEPIGGDARIPLCCPWNNNQGEHRVMDGSCGWGGSLADGAPPM